MGNIDMRKRLTCKEALDKIEALERENELLKLKLNPKVLYGIKDGVVAELTNVKVEYHLDYLVDGNRMGGWIEASDLGKLVLLTRSHAEERLKQKENIKTRRFGQT